MPEEEQYVVVGQRPKPLTLEDGRTVSVSSEDGPVKVQKDRRFQEARQDQSLQKVWVDVGQEGDVPEESPETSNEEVLQEAAESLPTGLDSDSDLPMLVDDLRSDLSDSVVDALLDEDVEDVDQLRGMSEDELTDINGIGPATCDDIQDVLDEIE